jgi:hypothetical protein
VVFFSAAEGAAVPLLLNLNPDRSQLDNMALEGGEWCSCPEEWRAALPTLVF